MHVRYPLTIWLALTLVFAGCSADMQGQGEEQEGNGAGGQASSSGGASAGGRPSAGGSTSAGGSAKTGGGAAGQSATAMSCPTYMDDFLPQIHTPVCSKCHQGSGRLGDWGVYSQAKANCATIGARVASGAMPPARSGYTLTSAQRSLVASWVRLGCPQTASDLPSTCK